MPPNSSFESQSFNPFSINEDFKNNDQGPNVNFYQTQISSLDKSYYIPNEVKETLENFLQKSFSAIHLNICSMSKNFESFREFLDSLFHIQYYLFLRNMVTTSRNFQLKSSNTWLRKLTPDLKKPQRSRPLHFLT